MVDSSCFLVSAKPSIYPVFGLFWTHVGPKFGSRRFFLGLEAGRNGPSFANPPTRRVVVIDFWTTLISVELRHEQTGHGGFRVNRDLRIEFQRDGKGNIISLDWRRNGAPPRSARRVEIKREDIQSSNGAHSAGRHAYQPAEDRLAPSTSVVSATTLSAYVRFSQRRGDPRTRAQSNPFDPIGHTRCCRLRTPATKLKALAVGGVVDSHTTRRNESVVVGIKLGSAS